MVVLVVALTRPLRRPATAQIVLGVSQLVVSPGTQIFFYPFSTVGR